MNLIEAINTEKDIRRAGWTKNCYLDKDLHTSWISWDTPVRYTVLLEDLLAQDWEVYTPKKPELTADSLREALMVYVSKTIANQVINDLGLE